MPFIVLFLCCFVETIHQTAIVLYKQWGMCRMRGSAAGSSLFIIAQNTLPEFHLSSQALGDKRHACLCIIRLGHITRTRNYICKYNFRLLGRTHHSPRMKRMFSGCMDNVCYTPWYKTVPSGLYSLWCRESLLLLCSLSDRPCQDFAGLSVKPIYVVPGRNWEQ